MLFVFVYKYSPKTENDKKTQKLFKNISEVLNNPHILARV